jgi:hypothetical protein
MCLFFDVLKEFFLFGQVLATADNRDEDVEKEGEELSQKNPLEKKSEGEEGSDGERRGGEVEFGKEGEEKKEANDKEDEST